MIERHIALGLPLNPVPQVVLLVLVGLRVEEVVLQWVLVVQEVEGQVAQHSKIVAERVSTGIMAR
jgi:hypothetical protein